MKEYLKPTEHQFKDWLARNPEFLGLTAEELAEVYGKSERRIYYLLKILEDKGHIKRVKPNEQNIILL